MKIDLAWIDEQLAICDAALKAGPTTSDYDIYQYNALPYYPAALRKLRKAFRLMDALGRDAPEHEILQAMSAFEEDDDG